MPKSIIYAVMMCLAYASLAGCGTKGPLYIPEQRYPQGAGNSNNPNDTKQHALQASIYAPSRAS